VGRQDARHRPPLEDGLAGQPHRRDGRLDQRRQQQARRRPPPGAAEEDGREAQGRQDRDGLEGAAEAHRRAGRQGRGGQGDQAHQPVGQGAGGDGVGPLIRRALPIPAGVHQVAPGGGENVEARRGQPRRRQGRPGQVAAPVGQQHDDRGVGQVDRQQVGAEQTQDGRQCCHGSMVEMKGSPSKPPPKPNAAALRRTAPMPTMR